MLAVTGLMIACTGLFYLPLLFVTGLSYADLSAELDKGLMAFILLPPAVLAALSRTAPRRYYVLPIPTSLFVGCTLANGALASLLMYGIVSIVLGKSVSCVLAVARARLLHGDGILLVAVARLASRPFAGLLILLIALFLMVLVPLGFEYVLPHLLESEIRAVPAVCCITCMLAFLLAVNGVARDRRGDVWSFGWLSRIGRLPGSFGARLTPLAISKSTSSRVFRSRDAAQFWYEWRSKGRMVFLFVLTISGGLWIWLCAGQHNPEDIDAAIGGLSGYFLFLTPLIGLYLGSDAGRFDRRGFAATRPLSDGAMASAVVKNVAAVVCSSSAIWFLGIAVALVVCRASASDWQQFQHAWADGLPSFLRAYLGPTTRLLLGVFVYVLVVWTVVGLGAALALARAWFVGVGGCVCVALAVSFLLIWNRTDLAQPVFAMVCLLGTLAAFLAAYRLRAISNRMIIRAARSICCSGW